MESYVQIFQGVIGIGSWTDFYMMLKQDKLIITNERKTETKFRICLQISQVKVNPKNQYGFVINNGFQDIPFRTKEKILQQKWVQEIEIAIQKCQKQNQEQTIIKSLDTYQDIEVFEQTSKILSKEHYQQIKKYFEFLQELKKDINNQNNNQILGFVVHSEKLLKTIGESLLFIQYEQNQLKELCIKLKEKIQDLNRDQKIKEQSGKKLSLQQLIDEEDEKPKAVSIKENLQQTKNNNESNNSFLSFEQNLEDEEINENQQILFKDLQITWKIDKLNNEEINIRNASIKKLIENNEVFQKYPIIKSSNAKRTELPVQRLCEQKVPFLQILKENFGKDLTKITMPVWLNEPLTITQKTIEVLKYWWCLRKANQTEDPYMKLAYIASNFFLIHSFVINRNKKPFNSLLGETCDFQDEDLKVVSEQVSHHPPIAAYHAESNDFILQGYSAVQLVFSMNGLAIRSTGKTMVTLKKTNETFSILFPDNELKNVLTGNIFIHHVGNLTVTNEKTKEFLQVNFPQMGWFSKPDYKANGFIYNSQKQKVYSFSGCWDSYCEVQNLSTNQKTKLLEVDPPIKNAEMMYYFNDFSLQMNYLTQEMINSLPVTDCRLRTDLRAYEQGDMNLASSEKNRLEENQRKRRKENEQKKIKYSPLFFEFVIEKNVVKFFKYKDNYWQCKETQDWPKEIIDLYN